VIEEIKAKFARREVEFSKHALDQSIVRHITTGELFEAVKDAEIIEDYPDDKYGPSCLFLGFTASHRPLHVQCSYPDRPLLKIVTIYEPASESWIDFRIRKT
jgi:Domain of unknown function (DUF4258)